MDKEKKSRNKAAKEKQGLTGYRTSGKVERASKEERKAVRATGARKAARKGELTAIYSEEKGGRLATSRNSGETVARTNTVSGERTKSTASRGSAGAAPGKFTRETVTREENQSFYGDTKLGRRLVKRAARKGNTAGISGEMKKATVKNRMKGSTK